MISLARSAKSRLTEPGTRVLTPLGAALRILWFEVQAASIARRAEREFRALTGLEDLKVHLGCGYDVRPGWLNIDLRVGGFPMGWRERVAGNGTRLVNHDLRRGLPLPPASCSIIYSSHFFEHLEYRHGVRLIRDCFRALRPGGTFRISVPDFPRCFAAYLDGDQAFFDPMELPDDPEDRPETRSIVDYINYVAYQQGEHRYIWDADKLARVLRSIGFGQAAVSVYRPDLDPDTESRRRYSLYFEAVKSPVTAPALELRV